MNTQTHLQKCASWLTLLILVTTIPFLVFKHKSPSSRSKPVTSKKKGEGISFLITETLDTDTLSSSYLGVSFQKSTSHNKRISPED